MTTDTGSPAIAVHGGAFDIAPAEHDRHREGCLVAARAGWQVLEEGGLPHDDLILVTIYVTIGLSVLAHGLTAAPLANRYATWFESHPREALAGVESSDVQDVRWRYGVGHSRAQDHRGRG